MNGSSPQLIDSIQRQEEALDQLIDKSSKVPDLQFATWAAPISVAFQQLARTHALARHWEHARGNFYNAAKFSLELQRLGDHRFPHLVRRDTPPPFHLAFQHTFLDAILSADEALLRDIAVSLEEPTTIQSDRRFPHFISAGLKEWVLGNRTASREWVTSAHKLEFFRLPYKGFSHALLGVIDNDRMLLHEGIELRLRAHKTRDIGSTLGDFSTEATALARLAHRAGITMNVQSPLIVRDLVEGGDRTTDDRVERIFRGLARADKRQSSWWGKIWASR